MLNSKGRGLRALKGLPSRELIAGIGEVDEECVISCKAAGVRSLSLVEDLTGEPASVTGVDMCRPALDVERNDASGDRSGARGGVAVCERDTDENVWES